MSPMLMSFKSTPPVCNRNVLLKSCSLLAQAEITLMTSYDIIRVVCSYLTKLMQNHRRHSSRLLLVMNEQTFLYKTGEVQYSYVGSK